MNRLWYSMAALFLLLCAALLWMQRGKFMDALNVFGQQAAPVDTKVSWANTPDVPIGQGTPGSGRLRHIITRLIQPGAIAYEAILRFDSDEAYAAFLKDSGRLNVLGSIPSLRAVRVGYDDIGDLNDIPDDADAAANYLVQLPAQPNPSGPGIQSSAVPFGAGSGALEWLGITDNAEWGAGIKIAVIDTGVVDHPTFGEAQITTSKDLVSADGNVVDAHYHGTAVASVAAGNHQAAPGVAPQAEILSFRVADANGNSDSFTLAEGILAAAEANADVINISLGSSGDSSVVQDAINAALESGSTIVAAAGNNGTPELTYPAAYDGVISVGSIDALGQRLEFSNTSEQLDLAAPGYDVPAAWVPPTLTGEDPKVIPFTGTSASAPFVSGAIAAIMSWDSNLSGDQAYEILVTQANEAGAPGADASYGNGVLNVGRVINAGETGTYDVGVASHYYAGDIQGNGREILQVVVENRGNELVSASILSVETPDGVQQFNLGPMNPGDVVSREIAVDTRRAEVDGQVNYSTSISLPGAFDDANLNDNQLTSSFALPDQDVEIP